MIRGSHWDTKENVYKKEFQSQLIWIRTFIFLQNFACNIIATLFT